MKICDKIKAVIKMEEKIVCHEKGKDPLYKTWHASGEHLFMYIYSGTGSIVCAEKVFPLKSGSLVFIAADTYHYTMPDNPEIYDRSKLNIAPQKFTEIIKLLGNNIFSSLSSKAIVYAEIDEKQQKEIDSVFNEISMCSTEDERELILISCCMRLLFFLNKYSVESTASATGIMGKAIDYINKNISSDININGICSEVNISKYYFCRSFKEHTGMTVMEYILKTRIILACNELTKTNLSITEISEKCGFSSVSYFCRVFKEQTGITPLKYRKNGLYKN